MPFQKRQIKLLLADMMHVCYVSTCFGSIDVADRCKTWDDWGDDLHGPIAQHVL